MISGEGDAGAAFDVVARRALWRMASRLDQRSVKRNGPSSPSALGPFLESPDQGWGPKDRAPSLSLRFVS
jgi:hypothetical protein